MNNVNPASGLELKFCAQGGDLALSDGAVIKGYASLWGIADQGGDIVQRGAYGGSLAKLTAEDRRVKLLWQHDPTQPIGVWDEVREDEKGLFVRGRLLTETQGGREAAALLAAGAIDGLSIGYRTVRAEKAGTGRLLTELELWEVSLVTFPMLPQARVASGADGAGVAPEEDLVAMISAAREMLA